MSRPRVLVACDGIGGLDSAAAGAALASGFAQVADVAVLPLASGGRQLAAALSCLTGAQVHSEGSGWWLAAGERLCIGFGQPQRPGWHPEASTRDVGEWILLCLAARSEPTVVLDLTGVTAHDGGAGLVAAAGSALAGRRLLGLVPAAELDLPATGAIGMLARRAHGAGVDLADLLTADRVLRAWAVELAGKAELAGRGEPGAAAGTDLGVAPGSGAAGGTGLAVLAMGGELSSPTQYCYSLAGAERTFRTADLVVTGCTEMSALDRGGAVVSAVATWADQAERPCIAFTTGTALARRELRTFGLEEAHPVPVPVTPDGLSAAAVRIAHSWFPGRPEQDVD